LKSGLDVQVFDGERIEKCLLSATNGVLLARRYFPRSIKKWQTENPRPADVSLKAPKLLCHHTGVDLLDPHPQGIIVLGDTLNKDGKPMIEDVYWCTKGAADRALEKRFVDRGLMTSWDDIPDIIIPLVYLKWVMTIMNQMEHGGISATAIGKLRTFLLALFPYVAREMTSREKERLKDLFLIPSALGGMG